MQIPDSEIENQFIEFMRVNNCDAHDAINFIMDGEIHRYRTADDKKSQTSGAYCIWPDGWPCGWVQDWRNGKAINWKFQRDNISDDKLKSSLTTERIKQMEAISKQHQADMQKQQENLHANASEHARVTFEQLKPAEVDNPYLRRKYVLSYGLRVNSENVLAVPMKDIKGRFISLQWIYPDGTKRFFTGANISGAFFSVALDILNQKETANNPICLGEGYSTMATIYELTKLPCVAAMSCGNLLAVAKALKTKYPNNKIVVMADNDLKTKDNPGFNAAQKVVKANFASGCAVPDFKDNENGSDWNDYLSIHGEDETRKKLLLLIREALITPEERVEQDAIKKISALMSDLDPSIQIDALDFIGGMFPRKFVSALVAQSGTGKTLFMQKMCSDLSIGGTIFDGFAENEPVRKCLIFSGEAGFEMMIRRGAQTKWAINPANVKVADQYKFESSDTSIMLDNAEGWKNVQRIVKLYKPDIIFWDSFMSFHEKDENKATEMKPIIKRLNDLARHFNCAVVLVHHSRKRTAKERSLSLNQDDVIGSSVFNRIVGLIIGIEPMKEDEATLLVRPLKTWFSAFMPFTYRMTEDMNGNTVMQTDLAPANVNSSRIAVWNYLNEVFSPGEWFTFSQIITTEINPNVTEWQLRRIIAGFVNSGKLLKRGATKSLEYSLPTYKNYIDKEGE